MNMIKVVLSSVCMIVFSNLYAGDSVYTSMALVGQKTVYAAVKNKAKGAELNSFLMMYSPEKMSATKILLPNDVDNREVVALIPAKANKLLVISQQTLEKGDSPQIHLFDPVKKSWKKIGQIDCFSFNKIQLGGDKLVLSCEVSDDKGETTFIDKEVSLKGISTLTTGDLQMPLAKIETKEIKAQFNGLPYEWESLKLNYKTTEKVFKP